MVVVATTMNNFGTQQLQIACESRLTFEDIVSTDRTSQTLSTAVAMWCVGDGSITV